jgi:signal-transduction protein with cAMP-binding, CBS, and nucleotidyltransferase domain
MIERELAELEAMESSDDDGEEEEESMMAAMQGLEMFNRFSDEAKEDLCSQMEMRKYSAGNVIFKQGERGDHLYVIIKVSSVAVSRV